MFGIILPGSLNLNSPRIYISACTNSINNNCYNTLVGKDKITLKLTPFPILVIGTWKPIFLMPFVYFHCPIGEWWVLKINLFFFSLKEKNNFISLRFTNLLKREITPTMIKDFMYYQQIFILASSNFWHSRWSEIATILNSCRKEILFKPNFPCWYKILWAKLIRNLCFLCLCNGYTEPIIYWLAISIHRICSWWLLYIS